MCRLQQCAVDRRAGISFGLFSPDLRLRADAHVTCDKFGASYGLEVEGPTDDGGVSGVAHPGSLIVAQMLRSHGKTVVRARDETAGVGTGPAAADGYSVIAAGAVSAPDNPRFSDPTLHVTVNGGLPFAGRTGLVRHVEYLGGRKVIGSGFPWNDGAHFALYFKQT